MKLSTHILFIYTCRCFHQLADINVRDCCKIKLTQDTHLFKKTLKNSIPLLIINKKCILFIYFIINSFYVRKIGFNVHTRESRFESVLWNVFWMFSDLARMAFYIWQCLRWQKKKETEKRRIINGFLSIFVRIKNQSPWHLFLG